MVLGRARYGLRGEAGPYTMRQKKDKEEGGVKKKKVGGMLIGGVFGLYKCLQGMSIWRGEVEMIVLSLGMVG